MGSLLSSCTAIDDDFMTNVQEAIGESIVSIPVAYAAERKRILAKMRRAAPNPYRDLLYKDYPQKNKARVNALALRNVTSDKVKEKMADQICELLQPEIEAKTADMIPIARAAALKAMEKAVKIAVNQAVDAVVIDGNSTKTRRKPRS